jgi:hypothetical protein
MDVQMRDGRVRRRRRRTSGTRPVARLRTLQPHARTKAHPQMRA